MTAEWIVEAIFVLVFVQVLIAYVRRRDPLQRDVALMFASVAVLFVAAVLRGTVGHVPWVDPATSVLLLGQPFLAVRLVRRVGTVRRWIYLTASAVWAAPKDPHATGLAELARTIADFTGLDQPQPTTAETTSA